jgi:hypothetical protein
MFNLVLRLTAAISISLASSLLIKWKTEFLTELIETKIYSNINNTLEFNRFYPSNKSDLIFLNYIERESLIMAFNKISYVSMWTVLIPLILMFYVKTKKSKVIY